MKSASIFPLLDGKRAEPPPEPVYTGPKTLEEMRAQHRERQARMRAQAVEFEPQEEAIRVKAAAAAKAAKAADEAAAAKIAADRAKAEAYAKQVELAAQRSADGDPIPLARRASMIIDVCALEAGLSREVILSSCRTPTVSRARMRAMVRIKGVTGWSLSRIGRLFGRDHSTVFHATTRFDPLGEEIKVRS